MIPEKCDWFHVCSPKLPSNQKLQWQIPFTPQKCCLYCIRFSLNLNMPSTSAAPKNCVSQYLEKPDSDVISLNPFLGIRMTSWGSHSLRTSEDARKAVFPIQTLSNSRLRKRSLHLLEAPGSSWVLQEQADILRSSTTPTPTRTAGRGNEKSFGQTL